MWIQRMENRLQQEKGNTIRSLCQDHGNYSDNQLWDLTRQCDSTSSLRLIAHSPDLAYLIRPCCVQILSQLQQMHLASTLM